MRVLVTEKIADGGLQRLRDAGHEVDVQEGLTPEELLATIPGAHALIIRSATQVTASVLAAGTDLIVVGRAGIGLDNVDVAAATECGVMVVNAPQSNTLSAAEHTMALLLAQARNVPQASAALKAGRWERSKWTGVELSDKTLGIIGLGRIGKLVAQRALAFGMKLVAYDPFVSEDRARQLSVQLLSLEDLMAQSDFITLHLAKTPETAGLIGVDMLKLAKPSLRVINVARGGIIDEQALADAISQGRVAGAGFDVFATEPCTDSPLFALDSVVVTPHLGASTEEAQDKAGDTIADMVQLALAGDFVPYAVNVSAAEASEVVRPYLALGEQLGRIFAGLCGQISDGLEIEYQGQIAEFDTRILTLSLLKGFFGATTGGPVSYVNAPQIAEEQGIEVRPTSTTTARDYVNLITVRGAGHSLSGTLVGLKSVQTLVMIDDYTIDMPPADHLLVVRNHDQP
ncbi:MAG: phosphoglycerate dehydrogenase, partial [Actinomycetes bacterium]